MKDLHPILRVVAPLVFLFMLPSLLAGEVPVRQGLLLGPLPWQQPAQMAAQLKENLVVQAQKSGLPVVDTSVMAFGETHRWQTSDLNGLAGGSGVYLVYFNMEVSRFQEGHFELQWPGEVSLYVDGKALAGSVKKGFEMAVTTGSHRVLLLLNLTEAVGDLKILWKTEAEYEAVSFHREARHRVSAELLMQSATVRGLALSPQGSWTRLNISSYEKDGSGKSRLEIRDTNTGRVVRQWHDKAPSNLVWSENEAWLAYKQGNDLWIESSQTGEARRLLSNIKGLGSFRWHPQGETILFHWEKEGKKSKKGVKRYRALEDRWTGWRNRSQVFQVDVASGIIVQLTKNKSSSELLDISPDGQRLLIRRMPVDYSKPGFEPMALAEIDLATGEETRIGQWVWLIDAQYNDKGLYLLGGPSLANADGSTLPADQLPNNYDGQLYHYDLKSGKTKSLSRKFDPSIGAMHALPDGKLLLQVTQGDRTRLYLFHPSKRFEMLPTACDVVEQVAVSRKQGGPILFRGTGVATPQQVYLATLNPFVEKQVHDPADGGYDQAELGLCEDWVFKAENGQTIDGRVYKPRDFDPNKRYPLLVYYYGGTVPVGRGFTGRYPFHLWAANGYVIYVTQPRGTVGYGQAYSAPHVNAWGRGTAEDIIAATQAFVADHDYVDKDKIGCLGASYGGFMTMYLTTRTDIFSAALSHAGISDLSGYWGKGWWGFSYSGVASQGSYPWNNPQLYSDQSPVFAADKVTTPLLLLHGDSDTNVPPEQSHVMYTALKLLGKDVELITINEEDHWIQDYHRRLVWWDTILSWFDKQLKDQPQWWSSLYPDP